MPRPIPAEELDQIEKVVRARPGITAAEIADVLGDRVPRRTLQFRLKRLVDDGRVLRVGEGRWARYSAPGSADALEFPQPSATGTTVREQRPAYAARPPATRDIAPRSESALMIREDRDGRTFTVRDLYEYVSSLGPGTPDESTAWIRKGRSSR